MRRSHVVPLLVIVTALITCLSIYQSRHRAEPSQPPECQCFIRMTTLWAASVSYCLENKLSGHEEIAPTSLAEYLRDGTNGIKCPQSGMIYPPFKGDASPACPSGHGSAAELLERALRDEKDPCHA